MVKNGLDGVTRTVNQIENALGQAGLRDQLRDALHSEWHFLGRLYEISVAAGDCVGHEPKWNHAREIERTNAGANTKRLPNHKFIDPAADFLREITLQQGGRAAG